MLLLLAVSGFHVIGYLYCFFFPFVHPIVVTSRTFSKFNFICTRSTLIVGFFIFQVHLVLLHPLTPTRLAPLERAFRPSRSASVFKPDSASSVRTKQRRYVPPPHPNTVQYVYYLRFITSTNIMALSYEGGGDVSLLQSYARPAQCSGGGALVQFFRARGCCRSDCFNYRCRLRSPSRFTRKTLCAPRKYEKRENNPLHK